MKIKLNFYIISGGGFISVEIDELNQNRLCSSSFLMYKGLVIMVLGIFVFLGWYLKLVKKLDFKKIS